MTAKSADPEAFMARLTASHSNRLIGTKRTTTIYTIEVCSISPVSIATPDISGFLHVAPGAVVDADKILAGV
ncbi:MAG: hypothetical protein OXC17_02730 [Aestuariivita sp.]|nr:hypothetical protein [Aestuariivita sp.]